MSQRTPFNPDATPRRRPGARDGRYTFACLQQWSHLFAKRAAMIQFSLPVNRSGLCDRCKHRQNRHREEMLFHVSLKAGGKIARCEWSAIVARPRGTGVGQKDIAEQRFIVTCDLLSLGLLEQVAPRPPQHVENFPGWVS